MAKPQNVAVLASNTARAPAAAEVASKLKAALKCSGRAWLCPWRWSGFRSVS